MRRTRGSAILFVVVLIAAATTILVAATSLSTNSLEAQRRREDSTTARYAMDAAVAQIMADSYAGTLLVPSSRTLTLGGATCSVVIADNSANISRTALVTGTTTVGSRTFVESRVVAEAFTAQPFYYTVFVNSGIASASAILTGSNGSNGDICSNGSIVLIGGTINGDVDSGGTVTAPTTTITGTTNANTYAINFPSVDSGTYQAAANRVLSGSLVFGFTFGSASTYDLVYHSGTLSISGSISGNGTIYCSNDITISADLTYANSASHLVLITPGKINISSSVRNFVGYLYCGNQLTLSGVGLKNLLRGNFACSSMTNVSGFYATYDPFIWNSPSEAVKLHIPGFWP